MSTSKLVIGIPNEYFLRIIDPRIKKMFFDFLQIITNYPILVKNVELKNTNNFFSSWKKVRLYESSTIHKDKLKSNNGQFQSDFSKMLIEGTHITINDYIRAKKQIKKIRHEFINIFGSGISVILVPTTIILAPKLRKVDANIGGHKLNVRNALLRNTILFNSIGIPAITIPLGFVTENTNVLPVGLQIIGPQYGEPLVLFVAKKMEELVESKGMFSPAIGKGFRF